MAEEETEQNPDIPLKKQADIPITNQTVRVSLKAPASQPGGSVPSSDQPTAPQPTAPQPTETEQVGGTQQPMMPVPMKKTASVSLKKETVRIPPKAYPGQSGQLSPTSASLATAEQDKSTALWDKAINHTLRVSLKAPPGSAGASTLPSSVDDLPAMGDHNEKMALWNKAINETLSVPLKATPQSPPSTLSSSPQPTSPKPSHSSGSNSNGLSHYTGHVSLGLIHSAEYLRQIHERVGQVVIGQDLAIERALIAILTSGHLLLDGPPGMAKTLLVSTLSKALHLEFGRIQFNSGLLPSDVFGPEILGRNSGELITDQGPIFTNLLLAEEIDQASPQVQAPLLEALQERKVTFGTEAFPLPTPFLVIATKTSSEEGGTIELPPAMSDRFLLCHRLQYPKPAEEDEILRRHLQLGLETKGSHAAARSEFDLVSDDAIGTPKDLVTAMEATSRIQVTEAMRKHAIRIVEQTRRHPDLQMGCSPRAGIALLDASRARALIQGREQVILKDLFSLAEDTLIHRIRLSSEALAEGNTPQKVIQQILTASTS